MVDIYLRKTKEMCRGGLGDAAHHLLAAESLGSWHLLTIARAKKFGSAQASEQLRPCRVGEDHPDVCRYVQHAWPM